MLVPLHASAQHTAPLVDGLAAAARSVRAPFFFPGHKQGRWVPQVLRAKLGLGSRVLLHDLPELPELDNLFAPEGVILRAQELAASAFGAERTWFLVNGSTSGVIAAIMAAVQVWRQQQRSRGGASRRPVVLLPRNVHKSAVHALVVSGAQPCWLTPEVDAEHGLSLGVATSTVGAALQRFEGSVAAVLLVSPTYQGVLSDVGGCASLCAAAGVPLLVDEAHGAHLSFLDETALLPAIWSGPGGRRPRGALWEGADVVVQSTHKVLGSMTQSAMLHASARVLDAHPALGPALSESLELGTSSSPSYLLLASLDAARWQLASPLADGRERLHRATEHASALRAGVRALPHAPALLELRAGPGVHSVT